MDNLPVILLNTNRCDYVDECYFGSIFLAKGDKIYYSNGYNKSTICFLRSLAKPLQASILADYNIIADYKLKEQELAIFCASHSGSLEHINLLKKIIKRFNIKISDLHLKIQEPLDLRNFNNRKTKLHNNCSAKHIMMLIACKYLGFNFDGYFKPQHPLQKLIHKKQNELSQYKSNILTYDGCSTPLWGLPFENVIIAYNNLFHTEKYETIIKSTLNNPYIFGGYDRLDSEIITLGKKNLFAKVGAGGFLIVHNFKKDETLLLKLTQNNNPIRKLIALDILNKLGWINCKVENSVYNQQNQKVAKYCYEFKI